MTSPEDSSHREHTEAVAAESATERQGMTAESTVREQRFRQILDALDDMVLVKGPGSRMLWANAAFRELYGMSNEALQGLIDAPFNEPDYTQQYIRDDSEVFASGRTLVIPDEPVTKWDGTVRRVRTTKSPIFDDSGAVVMLVAVCHDITERTRLEIRLRLQDRMASVGTLAAGVAHEINTPVQFVGDSVHFLREATGDVLALLDSYRKVAQLAAAAGPAPELRAAIEAAAAAEEAADFAFLDENIPQAFERCADGLQRVATIVRSMKEFAHPAMDTMAPLDLNRAVENTLTIARNEYKYVAELETDFGSLPPVSCYANEINQALLNIVVNAAHAVTDAVRGGSQRGKIKVKTWRDGDDAMVSIADTGTGISESIAPRVFEQFFTTKDVGKGTGQGLAMAWAAVTEKHCGELSFESTVGVGTTFYIRLPIAGKQS